MEEAVRAQVAIPFGPNGWAGVRTILANKTATSSRLGAQLGVLKYGSGYTAEHLRAVHGNVKRVLNAFAKALAEKAKTSEPDVMNAYRWVHQRVVDSGTK